MSTSSSGAGPMEEDEKSPGGEGRGVMEESYSMASWQNMGGDAPYPP